MKLRTVAKLGVILSIIYSALELGFTVLPA